MMDICSLLLSEHPWDMAFLECMMQKRKFNYIKRKSE